MRLPDALNRDRLLALADEHGTPLYVTSAPALSRRYEEVARAFPDARICYATKANTNPHILALLRELGASVDAVSLGEVRAAERAGFPASRIIYTGVFPPDEELRDVLARGLRINVNSVADLERVAEPGVEADTPGCAPDAPDPRPDASGAGDGSARRIGIRVNPRVGAGHHGHVVTGRGGTKFGVPIGEAPRAFERARELGLEPAGLHMHIGSGFLEPGPLLDAVERLAGLAARLEEDGHRIRWMDVGGGWGVPHRPDEELLDLPALADGIRRRLRGDAELVVEPGRYLVGESTVLLTRTTAVTDGLVGVDAGLHTLLRPALYDAYHHVTNLSVPTDAHRGEDDAEGEATAGPVSVVGPICETGDVLARDRHLGPTRRGDVLAIHTTGAYGFVMASRYNTRPLPAEVLVEEDGARLIRRREGWEDVFRTVPSDDG